VAPGGYAWWYLDAISDDGQRGLTLIAFVGSVFSPYYAWSRWKDPLDHCAFNVAIYSASGSRWAMTERRRSSLVRDCSSLAIGPSHLSWDAGGLTAAFDEISAPLPARLRGSVRVMPQASCQDAFALDADGRHIWRPLAPRARVEVILTHPSCAWTGNAYFDANAGTEPMENAFSGWNWARAHLPNETLLFYDVDRRDSGLEALALRVGADGAIAAMDSPPRCVLPPTFWRVPRVTRAEPSEPPTVRRTLEDTPFYARSILDGRHDGKPAEIVHESLSLDRLRSPIVRAMLPFRMPRAFA
jgi:carotenoid 1,2-hydratase